MQIFSCCIAILLALLSSFTVYILTVFPTAKLEEIFFQILAPVGPITWYMAKPFITYNLIPCCLFLSILFLLRKKKWLYRAFLLLLCVPLYLFNNQTHIGDYLYTTLYNQSSFIEKHYVDPKEVAITFPEQKRNLIHIYLESMESSFTDDTNGGAYKENYIPLLTALAHKEESFQGKSSLLNGTYATFGSTWSTGAIFSQEIGLPLKLPMTTFSMATQKHFFTNLVSLGDILEQHGYHNLVIQGSNARFAGLDTYFREHGNYACYDLQHAKAIGFIPQDYHVWFGFEDEKAFALARKVLLQAKEPFNLSLFTIDTHAQNGYRCRLCQNQYKEQYANVLSCSDRQVYSFLQWLKEQPFFANTTVVLTGDHLTMDKDFVKDIDPKYQRKTYCTLLNSALRSSRRREFSSFDLFPTILRALGSSLSGDSLGLGVDLFSEKETLVERYGAQRFSQELEKRSIFMEKLAKIKQIDIKSIHLSYNSLTAFLDSLKKEMEGRRQIVLIAVRNDVARFLTASIRERFQRLGLDCPLSGKIHSSYIGIISTENFEQDDTKHALHFKKRINDTDFSVTSAGYFLGNSCSIKINGEEFALMRRGFNIVVYDFDTKTVISSCVFDTYPEDW